MNAGRELDRLIASKNGWIFAQTFVNIPEDTHNHDCSTMEGSKLYARDYSAIVASEHGIRVGWAMIYTIEDAEKDKSLTQEYRGYTEEFRELCSDPEKHVVIENERRLDDLCNYVGLPCYSSNIEDSFSLMNPREWTWTLHLMHKAYYGEPIYNCVIAKEDDYVAYREAVRGYKEVTSPFYKGDGDTPALAICRAWLQYKESTHEGLA